MQKRAFGHTGFLVTPLGFGAAPMGLLQTERNAAGKLLNVLLDAGVNLIDTAASYKGLGGDDRRIRRARRDQFVLVSKCGSSVPQCRRN